MPIKYVFGVKVALVAVQNMKIFTIIANKCLNHYLFKQNKSTLRWYNSMNLNTQNLHDIKNIRYLWYDKMKDDDSL